jgi:hypothetical protein
MMIHGWWLFLKMSHICSLMCNAFIWSWHVLVALLCLICCWIASLLIIWGQRLNCHHECLALLLHLMEGHKFLFVAKTFHVPFCRMDLTEPTTSVGTRTDYSVGPWDYPACTARHLMAWSTRATEEKYSVRKLYMSPTVWKTPRRTRLVLSLFRLVTLPPGLYKARQGPFSHHLISRHTIAPSCNRTQSIQSYAAYRT